MAQSRATVPNGSGDPQSQNSLTSSEQNDTSMSPWVIAKTGLSSCRGSKSRLSISFDQKPKTMCLVRKWQSNDTRDTLIRLGQWLMEDFGVTVVVEAHDADGKFIKLDTLNQPIDLCICLGGDGTLLHLSSLFQDKTCPPVIAFNMGTLGFLTQFNIADAHRHLLRILTPTPEPIFVTLRLRLFCEIYRAGNSKPDFQHLALNECLLDRGSNACLAQLELIVDDVLVTVVQADGLIVATPTGSTAYSMSAGGCMVAPTVPAILITPICPHTLSFRPIVISDSSLVRIKVPFGRCPGASVSFDGFHRSDLNHGDEVRLSMSPMSIPTINEHGFSTDWYQSVVKKLHWNRRLPPTVV